MLFQNLSLYFIQEVYSEIYYCLTFFIFLQVNISHNFLYDILLDFLHCLIPFYHIVFEVLELFFTSYLVFQQSQHNHLYFSSSYAIYSQVPPCYLDHILIAPLLMEHWYSNCKCIYRWLSLVFLLICLHYQGNYFFKE